MAVLRVGDWVGFYKFELYKLGRVDRMFGRSILIEDPDGNIWDRNANEITILEPPMQKLLNASYGVDDEQR